MTVEIERDTSGEWGSDIFRCPVEDCPWPDNYEIHRSWCASIEGHTCYGGPTHQHRPKKGLGGKKGQGRSKGVSFGEVPRIVAIICLGMHMAVDNGAVIDGRLYRDEAVNGKYRIMWGDHIGLTRTIPESEAA